MGDVGDVLDPELARASLRATTWGGPEDRAALHRLADDIRQRAGFKVCAIEALRADNMIEYVAIAGDPDAAAQLVGQASPPVSEPGKSALDSGARYGPLIFVAREWMPERALAAMHAYGWTPDIEDAGDPEQWQAEDMLAAQLHDSEGAFRGVLYLDEPHTGKRPTPEELLALGELLELPLRAVVGTIEREGLTHQARVASAAREVVRASSASRGLPALLAEADQHLKAGLRAVDVRVVLAGGPFLPHEGPLLDFGADLLDVVVEAGCRAWEDQRVVIVEADAVWGDDKLADDRRVLLTGHVREQELGALVLVPLGAGPEPVGVLLVARRGPRWTDSESTAALDVGHDLGRAVQLAQAFEREQRLNAELQRLDAYRIDLIATISHELKNPIGVISGHLEMVAGAPDLPPGVARSLDLMERGAARLSTLTASLLELSRLDQSAEPPGPTPVDLVEVTTDVVDFLEVLASHHGVTIRTRPPVGPAVVRGSADELHRCLTNLVSNAVKYSDEGGHVVLGLDRVDDQVVFSCADDGLGISAEDQQRLFTEFFRSTNAEALHRPGTGLGLAIVHRIVDRHEGHVEVESELGVGTTFRVVLPAA